jgi:hypothetical protein
VAQKKKFPWVWVIGAITLIILYFVLQKNGIATILSQVSSPSSVPVAGVPSVVGTVHGMNIMSESPQSLGYTWSSVAPVETYGPNRSIYKGPGGDFVVW